FVRSFAILADGAHLAAESATFPSVKDVEEWKRSGNLPRLPVLLELTAEAHLPSATRSLAVQFPEVMGQIVLTIERPGGEPRSFALEGGEASPAVPVAIAAAPLASISPSSAPSPALAAPSEPGHIATAVRFIALGFE